MLLNVRPPTVICRLRAGLPAGAAVLVALATIASFLFGTGIIPIGVRNGVSTTAGVLGISLLVAYLRGRQLALPSVVSDELSNESKYICRPCSADNLRLANQIVQSIFGRDNIDFNLLEQWRLKNPKGFMEIVNEENALVGCFVVLGLEPSFMAQFIKGAVTESEISSEDVLPLSQARQLDDIYLCGAMVRDADTLIGKKRAYILIWCVLKYLKHYYAVSPNRRLYALALNKSSERLLRSLQFTLSSPSLGRADRHNMYEIKYTGQQRDKASKRTYDVSRMCSISYRKPQSLSGRKTKTPRSKSRRKHHPRE